MNPIEARLSRSMLRLRRNGVTLMETLFAIGILMVGLLGITAVLSTAGKNAVDSRTLSHSQILANSWLKETYARNMQNPANWVRPVYDGQLKVWRFLADAQITAGKSYCIDPLGLAFSPTVSVADSNYSMQFFPYYNTNVNPVINPTISASATSGVAWLNMPRMYRVTLGLSDNPVKGKLAEELFASQDELATTKARDATLPVARGFESAAGSSATNVYDLFKPSTTQEYSWFATLSPSDSLGSTVNPLYTLSIVVLKNRDRRLEIPSPSATGLEDPTSVPSQETMAWVVPMETGIPADVSNPPSFKGGGGGRVLLIGSANTESHLASGQWIMLSRCDNNGHEIFSWYRVAACDSDAAIMQLSEVPLRYSVTPKFDDPFGKNTGSAKVWVREVTLAGRDWIFWPGKIDDPNGNEKYMLNQVTTATIVRGAVNVHERVISLEAN